MISSVTSSSSKSIMPWPCKSVSVGRRLLDIQFSGYEKRTSTSTSSLRLSLLRWAAWPMARESLKAAFSSFLRFLSSFSFLEAQTSSTSRSSIATVSPSSARLRSREPEICGARSCVGGQLCAGD